MTKKFVITPDGEGFVDFTPEEEAQVVKDREVAVIRREAEAAAEAQKATDKASAVSKLEVLGLTSAEIDSLTK